MEVLGLDEDVHYQIAKLASARLCSTSLGQIVMDCVANPPKEGDESYPLFIKVIVTIQRVGLRGGA